MDKIIGDGRRYRSTSRRGLLLIETTITPLHRPRGEVAPLVSNAESFKIAIEELSSGTGALAVDAERASGYRYSSQSFLFQFYRQGTRIFLIDPIDLRGERELIDLFNSRFEEAEWIIHASTQDLACIREFGFTPKKLFDTELGARLAGQERVGLGALTQSLLALSLAKEHSAVDWSYRPLHPEWKNYAALDVDVLLEIYEKIKAILIADGKIDYAYQEFQSILAAAPPAPRVDPWRRTSGMHQVKGRRAIAIVRELWLSRDELAQELDIAQGRILPDLAISEIAILISQSLPDYDLQKFSKKSGEILNQSRHLKRRGKEYIARWISAIEEALQLSESDLPAMRAISDSLPPIKLWRDKAPLAYARLTHARFNLQELSSKLSIPMENLLLPDTLRRITWASERKSFDQSELIELLRSLGARAWQIELTLDPLERALKEREPRQISEEEEVLDSATSGPAPVGSDH